MKSVNYGIIILIVPEKHRHYKKRESNPVLRGDIHLPEEVKSLGSTVVGLINEMYDLEPRWNPDIEYTINVPRISWTNYFEGMAIYFGEFRDLNLEKIVFTKYSKRENAPMFHMSFLFEAGDVSEFATIAFAVSWNKVTSIVSNPIRRAGPAHFFRELVNDKAGTEIVRLNLMKDAFRIIRDLKKKGTGFMP